MSDVLDYGAAWGVLEGEASNTPVAPTREFRHYRPLVDAVDGFIREAQDSHRIFLGIDEFDRQMRGIGKGHLAVVVGYSHSGKTLVVLHALRHNRDKRVAMFIPDETQQLVLAKLAAMTTGVPAREIEQRVAAGDVSTIDMLRRVATEEFPNLAVFDKPLNPIDMQRAYDETTDVWGAAPDLVVVDFVDLVEAGETVQAKFDFLKSFGSQREVPLIAIHQTSRSAGAEGRKMTISSGSYGGETHATFMIGVRRKKSGLMAELAEQEDKYQRTGSEAAAEKIESLRYDLRIHEFTLTANVVKNKRPGGGLVDDIDFELETTTGRLFPLQPGELPSQYLQEVHGRNGVKPSVPATEMEMF